MRNRFIIAFNLQIRYLFQSYTRIVLIKVYERSTNPAILVIINTLKGIPPVRRRLRALPYAKLYNGILCQLAC